MKIDTIIVDNFLDNPDLVRESVLKVPFKHSGTFPGFRSDAADKEYQKMVEVKLTEILGTSNIKFRQDRDCFRFQLCLQDDSTWIHKDDTNWAGVLYLTPDADVNSGTGIFDENQNLVTVIGNVYNRLVLYRGDLFHRSLISGFGNDVNTGRLTQVFFFDLY
jgi:hypothetical protein